MIHLYAHAESVPETADSYRHDHKFLKIQGIGRMTSTIQYIHHRNRHDVRPDTAQILVKRYAQSCCRGFCHRHRHRQNGIGSQIGLIFRTVRIDEQMVNVSLIQRIFAKQHIGNLRIDIGNSFLHTKSQKTFLSVS